MATDILVPAGGRVVWFRRGRVTMCRRIVRRGVPAGPIGLIRLSHEKALLMQGILAFHW